MVLSPEMLLAIAGTLATVISTLFWISFGRTLRAEKQVDELLPMNREMMTIVKALQESFKIIQIDTKESIGSLNQQIVGLRNDLLREQGRHV